jgi:hypothetical protein
MSSVGILPHADLKNKLGSGEVRILATAKEIREARSLKDKADRRIVGRFA